MAIKDPALANPAPYPIVPFTSSKDIEEALTDPGVRKKVENYISWYQSINISEAMKNLTRVGQILQLVYSGSKGLPCNIKIVDMLMNYQLFVDDFIINTSIFVETSLVALKIHKKALTILTKDCTKVVQLLSRCTNLVHRMAEDSILLIEKSSLMYQKASEAINEAIEDEVMTLTEEKKILDLISDLKAFNALEEAEAVEKLKSQKEVRSEVEKTVKALGKVKKIFENTRLFWIEVERQCRWLGDMTIIEAYASTNLAVELEDEIKESGFKWLSLAKINHLAHLAMAEVKQDIEAIFNNLPNKVTDFC